MNDEKMIDNNIMKKLVIVGAGGHARSVLDILKENNNYDLVGCIDSIFPEKTKVEYMEEIPIIGSDERLEEIYNNNVASHVFVAIGNNELRKKIYEKVLSIGYIPINIISKYAHVSQAVSLGDGICIMPGAVVNVNSRIGNAAIINTNSSIDHDCIVGNFVHIAPGVAVSGSTIIGEGTHIGTNSAVIDGLNIGNWCYVGAGAAVVSDIEDNYLAYGVPAKKIRKLM